jgi:hypothetical protein
MSSPSEAAFWHEACSRIEFSPEIKYTLRMAVEAPDVSSPTVTMNAMLEGGG